MATTANTYLRQRPAILGLAKVLFLGLAQVPAVQAIPVHLSGLLQISQNDEGKSPKSASLWIYLAVAAALVLLGGAFAGLTIALMGQDEIYLQVIRDSGEGAEKKNAGRVLRLLQRGKHWVLVTLLLSNVITNETLPIVLDRSLGGGWPAVLGSTVLIVIFGEIVPQSVCVRYGLPIGAWMSPFVLALMYLMSPVAWPTAKLLDYLLGEDHGTIYKKSGLKTLVSLHRSMGEAGQRLHADEVTIISAVLDLKEKSVGSIMTPMEDVFTLSLDDVLDENTMDDILSQGYSRIPVHHPDNDENFVGMLLVKMLITYDPEDAKPVREFALATLPETRPDTSCLDIVNFFQEGKSHMVLVSDHPGEDHGAIGVVTLEDVIEELIGEEIVDESDVFIDVHKAIRRLTPAPRTRIPRNPTVEEIKAIKPVTGDLIDINEGETLAAADLVRTSVSEDPANGLNLAQRRLSANSALTDSRIPKRGSNIEEVKQHLKHLGPSNLASRPKTTRYASVKIKPGGEASSLGARMPNGNERMMPARRISESNSEYGGGIGEGLVRSGGKEASDGVLALRLDYGTLPGSPTDKWPRSTHNDKENEIDRSDSPSQQDEGVQDTSRPLARTVKSDDTIGELPLSQNRSKSQYYLSRGPARSGSITENVIDTNGIRKVVLETTSSSDSHNEDDNKAGPARQDKRNGASGAFYQGNNASGEQTAEPSNSQKKRRRRKKRHQDSTAEEKPLLGR